MFMRIRTPGRAVKTTQRGQHWPLPIVALLLAAGYAAFYLSVTTLVDFGGAAGTTFWPAAGATIAVLLRRKRKDWPALMAAVWMAEFVLDFVVLDVPLAASLAWATANAVEPAVAAHLLCRKGDRNIDLAEKTSLLRFLAFGVVVGPMVGALIGVGGATMSGFYSFLPAFPRWLAGDAIGVLALAPALMLRRVDFRRAAVPAGVLLRLVTVAVIPTAAAFVPNEGIGLGFTAVVVGGAALLLGAFRSAYPGTAIGVASVSLTVNFLSAAGYGPFVIEDQITGLIQAQVFLASIGSVSLLIAAQTRDLVSREAADHAKNKALMTVAHDVKGPLATIQGLAEWLRTNGESMTDDAKGETLAHIESAAARMAQMAGDILSLDRLRESKGTRFDVGGLAARLANELAGAGNPIIADTPPTYITADPVEVERILENLISNAGRHTPPGTPIWVRVAEQNDGVLLVVEDAGPGISDELKRSIFDTYNQGASERPGTGIGLALVARFAQNNGGHAWVEDRIGGGASFRVLFPTDA